MLNSVARLLKVAFICLAIIFAINFLRASPTALSSRSSTLLKQSFSSAAKVYSPIKSKDMSPKGLIESAINDNKVTVFSKSYCPFCKKAKASLTALNVDAKVFELDEMADGADWQAYLADKTGQRTVPMIFVGQTFVGGSSDLETKKNSGEFARLLAA